MALDDYDCASIRDGAHNTLLITTKRSDSAADDLPPASIRPRWYTSHSCRCPRDIDIGLNAPSHDRPRPALNMISSYIYALWSLFHVKLTSPRGPDAISFYFLWRCSTVFAAWELGVSESGTAQSTPPSAKGSTFTFTPAHVLVRHYLTTSTHVPFHSDDSHHSVFPSSHINHQRISRQHYT